MSEHRTTDEERTYQQLLALEPYRGLIRGLVGFTPELAKRNMERFEECMKRLEATKSLSMVTVPANGHLRVGG